MEEIKKRQSIFNRLYLNWKFEYQYIPRNIKCGIKNLITYFNIIWRDRDWDHVFILELLSFKLEKQAKYLKNRNFHTRSSRDSEIIMTCVRLIKLIKEDYYNIEYMDYQETRHWFKPIPGKELFTWESDNVSEKFDEFFKKYPLIYKKVIKNKNLQIYKHVDSNENQFEFKSRIASNI
jgi:hypothetical protein